MKVRIYTDGACSGNPGPGGWAARLLLPNDSQEISGFEEDTTNNRMELQAVVQAIKLALFLGYKKIDVYSDSAYVVNAVKKGWIKRWSRNGWKTSRQEDVKNKDLWILLLSLLKESKDIHLIKVAGHSGHEHNEAVDQLAKRQIFNHMEW